MNPHQKWFAFRFAAGIVLCAVFAFGYVIFTTRHAAQVARASTQAAANGLLECAQSPDDGRSLNDVLASCAAAAHAADAAAQALHHTARTSEQLASSRILFARIVAPQALPSSDGLAERLAVFADDLGGLAEWWPTASARIGALAAYDAETDLRDVSAVQDKEDFIRRLYLAKGALQLIASSMGAPQAATYDARLAELPEILTLIDRLIVATDTGATDTADTMRQQYIDDMGQLSRRANAMRTRIEKQLLQRPWSGAAREFAEDLR